MLNIGRDERSRLAVNSRNHTEGRIMTLCRMTRTVALACVAVAATSAMAQNQNRLPVHWDKLRDRIVVAEGIAWDNPGKQIAPKLTMIDSSVYLRNFKPRQSGVNGSLLRVTGILRKERTPEAPKGVQSFAAAVDYFIIDVVDIVRIDRIETPLLKLSTDKWVVRGMAPEAAIDLIEAAGMRKTALQISAPQDGSTAHAYADEHNNTLLFYSRNGRINSIQVVRQNLRAKSGGQWTSVYGYRLKSAVDRAGKSVLQTESGS